MKTLKLTFAAFLLAMAATTAQGQKFVALSPNGDSLFAKCDVCPPTETRYTPPRREPAIIHNVKLKHETDRNNDFGRPLPKGQALPPTSPNKATTGQARQYWGVH